MSTEYLQSMASTILPVCKLHRRIPTAIAIEKGNVSKRSPPTPQQEEEVSLSLSANSDPLTEQNVTIVGVGASAAPANTAKEWTAEELSLLTHSLSGLQPTGTMHRLNEGYVSE